ncbi:MAG: hypothetical protein ACYC8T_07985 [Myxococcaceae bacterium]
MNLRVVCIVAAVLGAFGCWKGTTSTCSKLWTAKDLEALQGGKWQRSSLFDTSAFCSVTFSVPGKFSNGVFLDVKRGEGSFEADRFLKGLTLVQKLPGPGEAYVGVAERGLQALVIKRAKGAVRMQFDAAFTPEQVREVPALLEPRLSDLD